MKNPVVRTERVGNLFQFVIWDRKQRSGTGSFLWNTRALARKSGHHYLRTRLELWDDTEPEEELP